MMDEVIIEAQLPVLLQNYPNLSILKAGSKEIRLQGNIDVCREAENFRLNNAYEVEIAIPLDGYTLPQVFDIGNAIEASYPHRYTDGSLCLETDTAIRLRFIDGFDLNCWMDEYVEVYFFSYEYYRRFSQFPFGERPHGPDGLIHTYQEQFHESDALRTANLLGFVYKSKSYRGHLPCPCGSGKKLRQCHGPFLFPFITDERYHKILKKDVDYISEVIDKIEYTKRNTRKTK